MRIYRKKKKIMNNPFYFDIQCTDVINTSYGYLIPHTAPVDAALNYPVGYQIMNAGISRPIGRWPERLNINQLTMKGKLRI